MCHAFYDLAKSRVLLQRFRLDTFVDKSQLPTSLAILFSIAPWRLFPIPDQTRGARLRQVLEELGPIFVKFGQMLSTRRDLITRRTLSMSWQNFRIRYHRFRHSKLSTLLRAPLGKSVDDLFAQFSSQPMASASVAQVHAATLFSGEEVVVKVVRPGIELTILQDIKLLFTLAELIEKYFPDGRRLRPVDVVNDYQITILDELDLQREGGNTSQLRRNFVDSDLLYVPRSLLGLY